MSTRWRSTRFLEETPNLPKTDTGRRASVWATMADTGRRASVWAMRGNDFQSSVNEQQRATSVLQGRLEEILVYELDEDGHTQYHHMSVRALYKYVLAAVTKPFHPSKERASIFSSPSKDKPKADDNNGVEESQNETSTHHHHHHHHKADDGEKQVNFDSSAKRFRSIRPTDHEGITYRERLGGWLHPRDMRRLVTPFSASNEPGIIVRRHAMLFNFDPLRAIILRDRLLVLVPEGADSILIQLEQRIRGGSLEVENSIFGSELGPDASSDLLASDTNSHHGRRALIDKAKELIRDDKLSSNDSSHTNPRSIIRQKVKTAASSLLRSATESNKSDGDSDGCMSDAETEAISEWEEMQANQWVDLPFELQAADSVLFVVCSILSQDAFELQEETLGYIHDVLSSQSGLQDDPLMGIRHIKDANREMSSRIKGFVQSMNRILDDDEDMALMNLSRLRTHPHRFVQPVPKEVLDEEADEPELILEAHLQVGLTLTNALDLIHGQIETASELVDQKLDASRNRLLFTNMVLNLLTLCVTMGTFVAGIFGMNLRSFMEDSESAFFSVVYGTVAGMFGSLFLMMAGLMYLGIMPRWFPTFT